ncbi:Pre-mRNA-processing-splicing factor 8 [Trichinella spiralis]|uniref:Pre-mRNA-processing-splicing factor 8 n=1 Tax=Trichinella spiralis TaxID=6334 RepID=A0A0V1AJ46_TRISP|nr:Pre-mRNA-processing-splicing factor 8 [Trichinella spiralis]
MLFVARFEIYAACCFKAYGKYAYAVGANARCKGAITFVNEIPWVVEPVYIAQWGNEYYNMNN